MGLQEALNELDGVDAKEFAEALQEQSPAHYKAIYTPAFGAGKTSVQDDLQDKETKLESLQSEREKLQKRIEDLQGEQPEVGELRGKYEAKLEELQQTIQAKDQQIKEVQESSTQTLRQKENEFFQERAIGYLMANGVEDRDVAEIKVEKAMRDGRVKFDDDLQPKVYEPDGEVPTPVTSGDQPHEVFGQSLMESIPEKFLQDRRPGASGVNPGGGSGKQWSREEINSMSPEEFEKHQDDINKAAAEGRIT